MKLKDLANDFYGIYYQINDHNNNSMNNINMQDNLLDDIKVIYLRIIDMEKKWHFCEIFHLNSNKLLSLEMCNWLDEYLDVHPEIIQRDVKIQELADLLEVPKYKLSIFFSRDMLMPYKDWLNKRRLDLFLLQLEAGALKRYSIMGLATRCGFQTKSNFYSIFKKFCGCSPFEYIENV
jgi:AraC-like DNA-binding protein